MNTQVAAITANSVVKHFGSGEVLVSSHWDGCSMKNRTGNNLPMLKFIHPKEGIIGWFDSLIVPKGAPNNANAEKFINFMRDAKNGAEISNFDRYASPLDTDAIARHIDPELGKAPEINIDPGVPVHFSQTCSSKPIKLYDRLWIKVRQ